MREIWYFGYPGKMGGANTECWHLLRLFREAGVTVHAVPTWGRDGEVEERLNGIGVKTWHVKPPEVAGLPIKGAALSMCNQRFVAEAAPGLRKRGIPMVWLNCMTILFDHERTFFERNGFFDAHVHQSNFQQSELTRFCRRWGDLSEKSHMIRGAFFCDEFPFRPAERNGAPFTIGRLSRPDADKWNRNLFNIYGKTKTRPIRAKLMGVNKTTRARLVGCPKWADLLKPQQQTAQKFLSDCHCLWHLNGGARENWPRVGLEAMAAGVPIVTDNRWGWREMIDAETGILTNNNNEQAEAVDRMAQDETYRLGIAERARERVVRMCDPERQWKKWEQVFESVGI